MCPNNFTVIKRLGIPIAASFKGFIPADTIEMRQPKSPFKSALRSFVKYRTINELSAGSAKRSAYVNSAAGTPYDNRRADHKTHKGHRPKRSKNAILMLTRENKSFIRLAVDGELAERLGRGLQILLQRFESVTRLAGPSQRAFFFAHRK